MWEFDNLFPEFALDLRARNRCVTSINTRRDVIVTPRRVFIDLEEKWLGNAKQMKETSFQMKSFQMK